MYIYTTIVLFNDRGRHCKSNLGLYDPLQSKTLFTSHFRWQVKKRFDFHYCLNFIPLNSHKFHISSDFFYPLPPQTPRHNVVNIKIIIFLFFAFQFFASKNSTQNICFPHEKIFRSFFFGIHNKWPTWEFWDKVH